MKQSEAAGEAGKAGAVCGRAVDLMTAARCKRTAALMLQKCALECALWAARHRGGERAKGAAPTAEETAAAAAWQAAQEELAALLRPLASGAVVCRRASAAKARALLRKGLSVWKCGGGLPPFFEAWAQWCHQCQPGAAVRIFCPEFDECHASVFRALAALCGWEAVQDEMECAEGIAAEDMALLAARGAAARAAAEQAAEWLRAFFAPLAGDPVVICAADAAAVERTRRARDAARAFLAAPVQVMVRGLPDLRDIIQEPAARPLRWRGLPLCADAEAALAARRAVA